MKLLRYGPIGQEKPGILDANKRIRDLSTIIKDVSLASLSTEALAKLSEIDLTTLPVVEGKPRIGACIGDVGKFICIGLNYADHAAESGMDVPSEPVVFFKATSAITGPNDEIVKPQNSTKLDWEVELGIVIGQKASYVSESEAKEYIAGYCTIHDVSEREFQLERQGQWVKGKSCDTFGPLGPWLVTKDEIEDPCNLNLWLEVNGKRYQDGNTRTMVYKPEFLVSYLSKFMSLMPGDIISTGTPPGVGLGQTPPVYLNIGDEVHLGVEGLGSQNQIVVEHS